MMTSNIASAFQKPKVKVMYSKGYVIRDIRAAFSPVDGGSYGVATCFFVCFWNLFVEFIILICNDRYDSKYCDPITVGC